VTKEVQWFWRRLFTFLFMGVNTVTVGWIVFKVDDPDIQTAGEVKEIIT